MSRFVIGRCLEALCGAVVACLVIATAGCDSQMADGPAVAANTVANVRLRGFQRLWARASSPSMLVTPKSP